VANLDLLPWLAGTLFLINENLSLFLTRLFIAISYLTLYVLCINPGMHQVQGIWAPGMDGSDINAVARSHSVSSPIFPG